MAIKATSFAEQKRDQFNTQASHRGFTRDLIMAINRTLNKIAVVTDVATNPDSQDNLQKDIDLDAGLDYVLSAGVDYWLILMGHRSGEMTVGMAFAAYESALADARSDRDMTATRAATNQETFGVMDTG